MRTEKRREDPRYWKAAELLTDGKRVLKKQFSGPVSGFRTESTVRKAGVDDSAELLCFEPALVDFLLVGLVCSDVVNIYISSTAEPRLVHKPIPIRFTESLWFLGLGD